MPAHPVDLGLIYRLDQDDRIRAAAYARATYDEERWIEMAIVRKDDVIELWQPGESSETWASPASSSASPTTSGCSAVGTRSGPRAHPPGRLAAPRPPWASTTP